MLKWGVTVAVLVKGRITRQALGQLKINIKAPNINPKTFVPGDPRSVALDPHLAARAPVVPGWAS
jgi:hypothetical protein